MKRVVVAGGGIIGASIAWHLARQGAAVTLVERDKPAVGATKDSFAWINATFSKRPHHYFELNRQGVNAWRRLQSQMSKPPDIQWGGSVAWTTEGPDADALREGVHNHQQWGYETHLLESPHELLPQIEPGPVACAAYSSEEGVLDPVAALRQFSTILAPPSTIPAKSLDSTS